MDEKVIEAAIGFLRKRALSTEKVKGDRKIHISRLVCPLNEVELVLESIKDGTWLSYLEELKQIYELELGNNTHVIKR